MRDRVRRASAPVASLAIAAAVAVAAIGLASPPSHAQAPSRPAPPPPAAPAPSPTASSSPATGAAATAIFSDALHAYHAALVARRLGGPDMRKEDVAARVAEGEDLMSAGRVDEAVARLAALVEHPQFELFADSEDGRAAMFRLGDALATAGIYVPARAYLRRSVESRGAWDGAATWARRAVRRLVDIAIESEEYGPATQDLAGVPSSAPAEVRGEI